MADTPSNFAFMARRAPAIAELGAKAEGYLADDPNTAVFKVRQLVEQLAFMVADLHRIERADGDDLFQVLKTLERRGYIEDRTAEIFHEVRRVGNAAVHELTNQQKIATRQLRNARHLCIWFESVFGDPDFKPPPFVNPTKPQDKGALDEVAKAEQRAIEQRLAQTEAERDAHRAALEAHTRRLSQPRVSFAHSFVAAWEALPAAERDPLVRDISALRESPDAVSLNPFDGIVDEKFQWAPIGADHCAVVARSPHGDVLLVAWIGRFEEALAWVRSKRVEVHAVLGSLQIYEAPSEPPTPAKRGLFAELTDEQLLRCGLPPLLVHAVRAVDDPAQLPALCALLPGEASDVLTAVAGGQGFDEALREAGLRLPAQPIDTQNFDQALAHNASQRRFADLDDRTFEQMLHAPIEQWRVFLHPSQTRVVRGNAGGPVRVLGGAGTGKTVALLHRVVHLLRVELADTDRLFVTTFTRTLADELRRSLAKLLTEAELARVTTMTLSQWAMAFVRSAGRRVQIASDKQQKECWAAAIAEHDPGHDQAEAFYPEEWDLVVQAQAITDEAGYLKAPRSGRGTRLNRRERARVWAVFAGYRRRLEEKKLLEWADLVRLAKEILASQPERREFRSVLVDEVQDFGQAELELLRALVPEDRSDLFLVGDAHQRIYRLGTTLSACGIQIRGRSFRLKVNYRTTEKIQRFAFGVLEGETFDDLDGGSDSLKGYRSLRTGQPPVIRLFATLEEERAAVVEQVRAWLSQGTPPESICVAARMGWLVTRYRRALLDAGIDAVDLDAQGESEGVGVRLSTLHRLKGTEFSRVLLAAVQEDVFPMRRAASKHADEASVEDFLHQERCLMYVAATRARDELVIMGSGKPSPFAPIPEGGVDVG